MKRIAIIGYGNMGKALYKAISQNVPSVQMFAIETAEEIIKNADVQIYAKLSQIAEPLDYIILAVKPQSFEEFVQVNQNYNFSHATIISIMAGVKIEKMVSLLKNEKVVRAMPNLGAQIGMSITGWFSTSNQIRSEEISRLISSFGESIQLQKEEDLDSITALFGSGPAYFFYLSQLISEKAIELGFNADQSEQLSKKLLLSAGTLLDVNKDISAKEFKERVTSKGGTTEAALNHLQTNKFGQIFKDALQKALERCKELNV